MNGAEREGLRGGGCDLKYKNVLHCKSLSPCSSMNGGAAEDRSGAAIKKVSEERRTHTHRVREREKKNAHMVCGMFRMIFSPRCQSLKSERMCARSNIGADALPANVS